MKLLTKNQITTVKQKQDDTEIRKIAILRNASVKETSRLNTARMDSESMQIQMNDEFVKFQSDILSKKSALVDEVTILEEKKRVALEPINDLLVEVKEKEKKVEDDREVLVLKEDQIKVENEAINKDKKEIEVSETNLKRRGKSSDEREELISEKEHELKTEQIMFSERKTGEEAVLLKDRNELTELQESVKQKEDSLSTIIKAHEKKEDELGKQFRLVADQRATLDRAFARLKK